MKRRTRSKKRKRETKNPDTERFDIHQKWANEKAVVEQANAWALMDDRPLVGRWLPVGGH
jgi:hypothetical protein